MKDKRAIGRKYEQMAFEYLKRQGYRILERNFFSRYGEIDLIAGDGRYLVFTEVKYRKDVSCGDPLEAVHAEKQKRICRTASYFCVCRGYSDATPCRFDVIAITGDGSITHIKHAFEYCL